MVTSTQKREAASKYWEVSIAWNTSNTGGKPMTIEKALRLLNEAKVLGSPRLILLADALISQIVHRSDDKAPRAAKEAM